jgi:hypothetical protein
MRVSALKLALLAAVAGSTTIQTLLGGSVGDPRIYWYFAPLAADTVDPTHPGYIVYQLLAIPEVVDATGHAVVRFTIWALDEQTVEDVRESLRTLFERVPITLSDSTVVYGKALQETDLFDETSNFAGRALEVRFGHLAPL